MYFRSSAHRHGLLPASLQLFFLLLFIPACPCPQDTSRRIVAYDLLSGSMLGVLSLASDSVACANTGKKPGNQGGGGAAEGSLEVPVQKEDIVWASGGNHLAAIVPTEEEVIVEMHVSCYYAVAPIYICIYRERSTWYFTCVPPTPFSVATDNFTWLASLRVMLLSLSLSLVR